MAKGTRLTVTVMMPDGLPSCACIWMSIWVSSGLVAFCGSQLTRFFPLVSFFSDASHIYYFRRAWACQSACPVGPYLGLWNWNWLYPFDCRGGTRRLWDSHSFSSGHGTENIKGGHPIPLRAVWTIVLPSLNTPLTRTHYAQLRRA